LPPPCQADCGECGSAAGSGILSRPTPKAGVDQVEFGGIVLAGRRLDVPQLREGALQAPEKLSFGNTNSRQADTRMHKL